MVVDSLESTKMVKGYDGNYNDGNHSNTSDKS